jgi:PHS family inorganic phosphate transporter-like MFS transporter
MIIYAAIFFFSNFGPNSTTFIVPIEIYLARFRSTLHGFCVACGKIDAIVVGAFIFNYIAQSKTTPSLAGPNPRYLQNTDFILLSLNFLGLVLTFFIPKTHQKPLKDLTGGK